MIVDPYYNVPLEKVTSILTDKKNYIKQLCKWNPDFIVSFIYLFIYYYLVQLINIKKNKWMGAHEVENG